MKNRSPQVRQARAAANAATTRVACRGGRTTPLNACTIAGRGGATAGRNATATDACSKSPSAINRKGPLFERAAAGRAEEAQRRMDAAMSRMEREGKSYDLWGTGIAIVPVPDDHFAYRPLGAR